MIVIFICKHLTAPYRLCTLLRKLIEWRTNEICVPSAGLNLISLTRIECVCVVHCGLRWLTKKAKCSLLPFNCKYCDRVHSAHRTEARSTFINIRFALELINEKSHITGHDVCCASWHRHMWPFVISLNAYDRGRYQRKCVNSFNLINLIPRTDNRHWPSLSRPNRQFAPENWFVWTFQQIEQWTRVYRTTVNTSTSSMDWQLFRFSPASACDTWTSFQFSCPKCISIAWTRIEVIWRKFSDFGSCLWRNKCEQDRTSCNNSQQQPTTAIIEFVFVYLHVSRHRVLTYCCEWMCVNIFSFYYCRSTIYRELSLGRSSSGPNRFASLNVCVSMHESCSQLLFTVAFVVVMK